MEELSFPVLDYKRVRKPLPWRDLLVEIGFGRGEFLLRLAEENPHRKVLGFEVSGVSVEKLLRRLRDRNPGNVFCVRIDAYWGFSLLLEDCSVERIYMNYPDPWFKKRHVKRRLTRMENLYLFARKLKGKGEIRIRTDHPPFIDYTIEEAEKLGCFSWEVRKLRVQEPLTKYEERWLRMGREIRELILRKEKEPRGLEVKTLKEVAVLFPVEVKGREPRPELICNQEFSLPEGVHLRFFDAYSREGSLLIEVLLSEKGFVQKFFVSVRRKGDRYVVDVSPFSQVLRTEGVQRAVRFVAERGFG